MGLVASNYEDLRKKMLVFLRSKVPKNLSSDEAQYKALTGLSTDSLKVFWSQGKNVTGCNSFNGTIAQAYGAPQGSTLARGFPDISKADKEVPGCWIWANSPETIAKSLYPKPGDFYSSPFPGQKFGHVGIVVEFDIPSMTWRHLDGGQGGQISGRDFIKWSERKQFHRDKINGWIDMAKYLMPDGELGPDGF